MPENQRKVPLELGTGPDYNKRHSASETVNGAEKRSGPGRNGGLREGRNQFQRGKNL